jgi:hypothetical protein
MDDFEVAPGRLRERLRASLSGHHALFEIEDIRAALAGRADASLDPELNDAVGSTLLSLARDAWEPARGRVQALSPAARIGLIRLWFRLLSGARELRGRVH